MSAPRPPHERLRGFTLIETLVVVALTGMISLVLLSGFGLSRRAWTQSLERAKRSQQATTTRRTIETLLRRAVPERRGSDEVSVRFAGLPTSVEFLAPLPLGFGAADLVVYRLRCNNGKLLLGWHLDRVAAGSGAPLAWREEVLADQVATVSFAYYGRDAEGAAPAWHELWQDRSRLPALIRIVVSGQRPELIETAPLVTASLCPPITTGRCG